MHISIEIMIIKPERNDWYETHGIHTEKNFCIFFFLDGIAYESY